MKISVYVRVHIEKHPENFLKLFTHEVGVFLKKWAIFEHILLLLYIFKQTFHMSQVRISQNVTGVIMRNLRCIIFV